MKYIRAVVIVLFAAALGVFGYAEIRQYRNADPTPPELVCENSELHLSCSYSEEELMAGLSASDREDGDLTGQIMLGSLSRFYDTGKCKATYVVFDSANQAATLTREIVFDDYRSPVFTLEQPLVFTQGSTGDVFGKVGARDLLDGDISSLVQVIDTDLNYSAEGDYSLAVQVSNSFGDLVSAVLPVHVVTAAEQKISIQLKEYLVYLKKGENLVPASLIAGVRGADGTAYDAGMVSAESSVNSSKPGCYEVKYTVQSPQGARGVTWLTVVVE